MNQIAYIGLGSNIGDREQHLQRAVLLLHEHENIAVLTCSSIYETDPVGYTEQDRFLNQAIKISTNLTPQQLLNAIQDVELQLGRTREIHWGPRTIDLDILLYNHENIEAENLIIPHPRMLERAFVLIPLLEICGELHDKIPRLQLEEMRKQEGVTVWKQRDGGDEFARFES